MTALLVALAGAAGSLARYGTNLLAVRLGSIYWGTLAVNLLGSMAIGFVFALYAGRGEVDARAQTIIATGFLGGFTTYSAFAYESLQLLEKKSFLLFVAYVGSTLILGLAGCALGIYLGRRV